MRKEKRIGRYFEKFSGFVTNFTGRPIAFISSFVVVLMWAILGPVFHFSDTWQLTINTGTTIITFLMVFVIQHTQNKESMAMQLKLNELIAATKGASNRLIDIEDLDEEELKTLKDFYIKLSKLAEASTDLGATHSVDEAEKNEAFKSNSN